MVTTTAVKAFALPETGLRHDVLDEQVKDVVEGTICTPMDTSRSRT
eukprot:COSAG01_NODE_23784_length_802_cov_0.749644_1_plen_46_part_00